MFGSFLFGRISVIEAGQVGKLRHKGIVIFMRYHNPTMWSVGVQFVFINLFTNYSWHTILYYFQVYNIVIRYLYTLQSDHPSKKSIFFISNPCPEIADPFY